MENSILHFKYSPLFVAAHKGHLDIVKYFIEELKCDVNYSPKVNKFFATIKNNSGQTAEDMMQARFVTHKKYIRQKELVLKLLQTHGKESVEPEESGASVLHNEVAIAPKEKGTPKRSREMQDQICKKKLK